MPCKRRKALHQGLKMRNFGKCFLFQNFIYLGLEGEARLAVTDKEHSDNEVSYTGPVFAGTDDSDYPKEIYSFLQSTHNNGLLIFITIEIFMNEFD